MLGAQQAGHEAEKIFLREAVIHPCLGCETCRENGGVCVQKDDMGGILEKMITAQVIVMATPVYFYSMNAQMKALIDRTLPRYTEMKHKALYFIATAAATDKRLLERTIEGFRGFADCLDGAREKGALCVTGVWKRGDVKSAAAMQQAWLMGRNA